MKLGPFLLVAVLWTASSLAATGEQRPFHAVINKDGVQRVEMMGGKYFYIPNHIIVKKNVPVELVVRKEPGMVPHDIVIKAPEAGIVFEESLEEKSKTIRFTPTKTGSFPFYCSKKLLFLPSHREEGMEGVLEVTE